MSKLGKLLGAPRKITIDGIEIELIPLKVKDMMAFGEKDVNTLNQEEQLKMNRDLIKKSISGEEVTDEEVDNLSTKAYTTLISSIMDLNGFGEDGPNKAIKDKIEQFRAKQGSNNSN